MGSGVESFGSGGVWVRNGGFRKRGWIDAETRVVVVVLLLSMCDLREVGCVAGWDVALNRGRGEGCGGGADGVGNSGVTGR